MVDILNETGAISIVLLGYIDGMPASRDVRRHVTAN